MIKFCLAATAAFGIMTGIALAQTQTLSTTRTTTTTPPVIVGGASDSSTLHSVDSNGVVTDRTRTNSTSTTVTPSGDLGTTRKTTETTTVR